MKFLFLSHYFPPEVNAPATRTYEHCKRWVKAGHEVTVITCVPNAPAGKVFAGYKNRILQKEFMDGIAVVRVWSFPAANSGFVRRTVNYLSSMISMVFYVLFSGIGYDRLIATSPQFFTGWAGLVVSFFRKKPFILEIRDIWPESILSAGAMRQSTIIRILEKMEMVMYRKADHIVAAGASYRENIMKKGVESGKISVITNGVDMELFNPEKTEECGLEAYRDKNAFICSYIGTAGMAHGLEVIIRAALCAGQEKPDMRTVFIIAGDGAARTELERMAKDKGLSNVHFTGLLAKKKIPGIIAASDACLIHLKKNALFATVIPSKMFEFMAMNVPVIMGVEGEARNIVLEARAGETMEPENEHDLLDAIARIKRNGREQYKGRQYAMEKFDRDVLAMNMLDIVLSAGEPAAK